jgi:hypothetical protein
MGTLPRRNVLAHHVTARRVRAANFHKRHVPAVWRRYERDVRARFAAFGCSARAVTRVTCQEHGRPIGRASQVVALDVWRNVDVVRERPVLGHRSTRERSSQIVPRPRARQRLARGGGLHVVPHEMDVVGRHLRGVRREVPDSSRRAVGCKSVTEQSSLEDDRPVVERHEKGPQREHAPNDMRLEGTRIRRRAAPIFRAGCRARCRARVTRHGRRQRPLRAGRERQQPAGKSQTMRAHRHPRYGVT